MKKLLVSVLAVVMMFSLVGCGEISYDDIAGDWTVTKVNEQTIDDYAKSLGVDPSAVYTNYTVKDDDTITATNSAGTQTLKITRKSDGFEVMKDGSEEIMFSVSYDKDKKTLSFAVDVSGTKVTYTLEKGKKELTAATPDTGAATGEAQ